MKKLSIRFDIIQKAVPKVLRMGATLPLLSFILLFLVAVMITGAVWYWSLRLEGMGPGNTGTLFRKDTLLEIIDVSESRQKAIDGISSKGYRDVFFPEEQID